MPASHFRNLLALLGASRWDRSCYRYRRGAAQATGQGSTGVILPAGRPVQVILPIGANPSRGKITRKGGRRPSRVTRSALARDLARFHTGAPGGWPALAVRAPGADRCGAEPVRRAAGTGRALTPPWPGGPKTGRRRPGVQRFPERPPPVTGESCAAHRSAHSSRGACQEQPASPVGCQNSAIGLTWPSTRFAHIR